MTLGRRKRWIAVLAMAILGVAGYHGGRQLWAMHHYRQAQRAQQERDFRGAADHLECVLAVWPHDPGVHLCAARAARRQGDMDRAAPHLRACAPRAPPPTR